MTNEELVFAIKGGDTGRMPQLWEQVRRFVAMKAKQYYYTSNELVRRRTTEEDLIQSGYFALLKAIEYFKLETTYSFISFLNMTLKTAFATEAGLRGGAAAKDAPLSLNAELDDESDSQLMDVIADINAADTEETAVESVYTEELHAVLEKALANTTDLQERVLRSLYYFGMSKAEIAETRNCTRAYIDSIEKEGLSKMRHGKYRNELLEFCFSSSVEPRIHTDSDIEEFLL